MTIAILHHDDWDGIVSAWVVSRNASQPCDLYPVQYGKPLPARIEGCDHVYVVDFSYPADVLNALAANNARLTIIDHHKSAIESLQSWTPPANATAVLKSHDGIRPVAACELTWWHLSLSRPPLLVQYVATRDTWRFDLPHSKAVSVYMQTLPMTLDQCEALHRQLHNDGESAIELFADRGAAIIAYQQQCITAAVGNATPLDLPGPDGPCHGMATNMPVSSLISDTAQALANRLGDATLLKIDFGCCYFVADDEWVYSLRSVGSFDVSALAKSLGGGGHARAAGFKSATPPWGWS